MSFQDYVTHLVSLCYLKALSENTVFQHSGEKISKFYCILDGSLPVLCFIPPKRLKSIFENKIKPRLPEKLLKMIESFENWRTSLETGLDAKKQQSFLDEFAKICALIDKNKMRGHLFPLELSFLFSIYSKFFHYFKFGMFTYQTTMTLGKGDVLGSLRKDQDSSEKRVSSIFVWQPVLLCVISKKKYEAFCSAVQMSPLKFVNLQVKDKVETKKKRKNAEVSKEFNKIWSKVKDRPKGSSIRKIYTSQTEENNFYLRPSNVRRKLEVFTGSVSPRKIGWGGNSNRSGEVGEFSYSLVDSITNGHTREKSQRKYLISAGTKRPGIKTTEETKQDSRISGVPNNAKRNLFLIDKSSSPHIGDWISRTTDNGPREIKGISPFDGPSTTQGPTSESRTLEKDSVCSFINESRVKETSPVAEGLSTVRMKNLMELTFSKSGSLISVSFADAHHHPLRTSGSESPYFEKKINKSQANAFVPDSESVLVNSVKRNDWPRIRPVSSIAQILEKKKELKGNCKTALAKSPSEPLKMVGKSQTISVVQSIIEKRKKPSSFSLNSPHLKNKESFAKKSFFSQKAPAILIQKNEKSPEQNK